MRESPDQMCRRTGHPVVLYHNDRGITDYRPIRDPRNFIGQINVIDIVYPRRRDQQRDSIRGLYGAKCELLLAGYDYDTYYAACTLSRTKDQRPILTFMEYDRRERRWVETRRFIKEEDILFIKEIK